MCFIMESTSLNVDISRFVLRDADIGYGGPFECDCNGKLMKMLEEGLYADVTLKARGGSIQAHRSVLASCSPVFKDIFKRKKSNSGLRTAVNQESVGSSAMFKHPMHEQLTSIVEVSNMSIDSLRLFLILLYFPNDYEAPMPEFAAALDKHFDEFLGACIKYQVDGLNIYLSDALSRNLTPENCWDYYHKSKLVLENWRDCHVRNCCYADHCSGDSKCNNKFLVHPNSVCRDYILDNFNKVMASDAVLLEMKQNSERLQHLIATHLSSKHPKENREEEFRKYTHENQIIRPGGPQIPNYIWYPNVPLSQEQQGQRAGGRHVGAPQQQQQLKQQMIQRDKNRISVSCTPNAKNTLNALVTPQEIMGAMLPAPLKIGGKPIALASLASVPPEQQRILLGEQLYRLVDVLEPNHPGKVTGMLLEMDETEVLHLIESPTALKAKVAEAMEVLCMAPAGV